MTETIHVSGSGEVASEPETAEVVVAITVEDDSVRDVREELARRYEDVEEALLEEGFEDDDFVTADYGIRTQRPRDDDDNTVTYVGSHRIEIDAGAVDAAGTVIDVTIEAGATDVENVTFRLTDDTRRERRNEALELAVSEAREDAAAAAAAAGRSLGAIAEMSVDRARVSPTNHSGEAMALSADSVDTTTSIQSGDVSVNASVSITYELRHE